MWNSLQRLSEHVALAGGVLMITVAGMVTASVAIRSPLVGGRGVPVILVGRQRMDGYDAGRLDAMLRAEGL